VKGKIMRYKQLLLISLLGCGLLVNSGCPAVFVGAAAGGAAGAGTIAYVGGELKSSEEVSLNRAWKATQMAMRDLEFSITDKGKDAFDAELRASGAGGKKIRVALKKISDTRTEIRIRVGTFGDESLSLKILERIKNRF
jgi:hypothetical protein